MSSTGVDLAPARAVSPSDRLIGPDVTRALAMTGVVAMNYIGYSILLGARRPSDGWQAFFDPWTGPLATRFAATFVVVAGIGATLLARRGPRRAMRLRFLSRGAVLYIVGLGFDLMWNGSILPYYGALFMLAALIITWSTSALIALGLVAAIAAGAINAWAVDTPSSTWLTDPAAWSPEGLWFGIWVNGTHPLLPWLAFFTAGIVLGRVMTQPLWRRTGWWVTAAIGVVLWTVARVLSEQGSSPGWSVDPWDRGVLYTASALGSALVAVAVIDAASTRLVAGRGRAVVDWLATAGQVSLTVYIVHALVFNVLVDWSTTISVADVADALLLAAVVVSVTTVLAVAWARRYGRGPAEQVYRMITY